MNQKEILIAKKLKIEHKGGVPVPIVSVPVLELENRSQIKSYFGTGPKVMLNLGPVPK